MLKCKTEKCNNLAEIHDDWSSGYCGYCEDRLIERENKRREWDHYHPGEPCPECELEP